MLQVVKYASDRSILGTISCECDVSIIHMCTVPNGFVDVVAKINKNQHNNNHFNEDTP